MSITAQMNALDRWGLMNDLAKPQAGPAPLRPETIKKYVWTLVDAGPQAANIDGIIKDYLSRQLGRPELFDALRNPGSVDQSWISEAPEADQVRKGHGAAVASALQVLSTKRNRPELALQLAVERAAHALLALQDTKAQAFYDASGRPNYRDPSEIAPMHQAMHEAKGLGELAEALVPYLSQSSDPTAVRLAELLGEQWRVVEDRMRVKWR